MRLTRLYVPDTAFTSGLHVPLEDEQAHYLLRVLRMQQDDAVIVFNEQMGAWRAQLHVSGKKAAAVLDTQVQQPTRSRDVTLLAAPLKKEAWYFLLEKATELGVRTIQPVVTDYTQTTRVNLERDRTNVLEASRQCERTDIPAYHDVVKLTVLLRDWDPERVLCVALERSDARPALDVFQEYAGRKMAILIGPEGGFSKDERALFAQHEWIIPIALGDLILRAETASMSALALYGAA